MVAAVDIDVVTSAGAVIPFNNVGYLQATKYLLVPSDNYRVLFSAPNSADTSGALVKIPATLMKNTTYQVAAAGLANTSGTNFAHSVSVNGTNVAFGLDVISGSRPWSISPTTVSIAVFHHSPDAPMVDAVGSTGSVLVNDISFGEYQGYLPIPTIADGQIRITPANDNNTTVATFAAPLTQLSGLGLTIFATGFLTPNDENVSNLQPFGLWVAFPNGGNLVELTPVTSLEGVSGISQMNLFPNPVNEVSTLTFSSTRSFNAELSIVKHHGPRGCQIGSSFVDGRQQQHRSKHQQLVFRSIFLNLDRNKRTCSDSFHQIKNSINLDLNRVLRFQKKRFDFGRTAFFMGAGNGLLPVGPQHTGPWPFCFAGSRFNPACRTRLRIPSFAKK